jgi:hypothetical protein
MIIYESQQDWNLFHTKMSELFGIEYQYSIIPELTLVPSENTFLRGKYGVGIPKPGTSAALMGNTRRRGKKFTEEQSARLSAARIGNTNRLGTTHTEDIKRIISERTSAALKGKKQKTIQCPHCSKVGGVSNMTRYHFEFCKVR